jgi:hypothetical protein
LLRKKPNKSHPTLLATIERFSVVLAQLVRERIGHKPSTVIHLRWLPLGSPFVAFSFSLASYHHASTLYLTVDEQHSNGSWGQPPAVTKRKYWRRSRDFLNGAHDPREDPLHPQAQL